MRSPRITAAVIAAAFTATTCTAFTATAAQAAPAPGPRLLVPAVKAVHSSKPTWVKAYWGSTADICDAKVTVEVGHTDVLYPSNTDSYTSFSRGDTLAAGSDDFTAFQVTTPTDRTIVRAMHLTIGYRMMSKEGCSGAVLTRTFYASLPVRKV